MKWSVGPKKSAVMIWGKVRIPDADRSTQWTIGSLRLPLVAQYKYLGLVLSCAGGWGKHVEFISGKVIQRSREIIAWARQRHVTVDIVERMWRMYVESSALFAVGVLTLTNQGQAELDRLQRRVGRMILGHDKHSPTPAVTVELGWIRWSVAAEREGLRLFWRLQ